MLVWLASYPRSGNTLFRILLNRCFGLETYSIYDDPFDVGSDPALRTAVAHVNHRRARPDFIAWAQSEPGVILAKTHEMPTDDSKAIYIVRDGRAAIVSYSHYLGKAEPTQALLYDILNGSTWGGAWSDHVEAWILSGRPDTLVLRFETLIADPGESMKRVARFLGLPEPARVTVDFAELNQAFPKFFRSGSNAANIAELSEDQLDLFWRRHGLTMNKLGFFDDREAVRLQPAAD